MYTISPVFNNFLKGHSHEWRVKVAVNGVEYGMDTIVDFTIDNSLTLSEEFELGSAILGKLTIAMRTSDTIPPNAKIVPYVAMSLDSMTWDEADYAWDDADWPWDGGQTEWLPLGEFYIDNRQQQNSVWVFECYDKLVWADVPYISQLTYPATMRAVWDEICTSLGYAYDSTVVIDPTLTVPVAPTSFSKRQILGYIAGANAACMYVDKSGTIRFKQFMASDSPVYELTGGDYNRVVRTNPVKTYTRILVYYDDEAEPFEAGSGTDGQTLIVENPLITTQQMADKLLTLINGFSYVPITMNARGFPQLEAGDRISFGVNESMTWDEANVSWDDADFPWDGIVSYETVLLHQVFTFKGGLAMDIEAPAKSEQESEFVVEGTLTQAINRLNRDAVIQGRNYFGLTITREDGLTIERNDHKSRLILNSDVMDWQVDGQSALYYDAIANRLKFTGTLEGVDGIFSGDLSAAGGTFAGTLQAASGTFTGALQGGSISIGSGNNVFRADTAGLWAGNANFASAPFRVNMSGQLVASNAQISGSISSSTISGGTITGALIRTAASGYPRIELSSNNALLDAWATSSNFISLLAFNAGVPSMVFGSAYAVTVLLQQDDKFQLSSGGGDIYISSGLETIQLNAPKGVYVNGVRIG